MMRAVMSTHRLLAGGMLAVFAGLCVLSIQNKSLTYDEPLHYRYGRNLLLHGNPDRFDDSKMPFSALNALPRAAGLLIQRAFGLPRPPKALFDARSGRHVTIAAAVLLGGLVYHWSAALYGVRAGLLSLFLYAFSPTVIAHARLITTDLYCALMTTAAAFFLWRFLNHGGIGRALASAVTLGLAQLAKYTCVYLFPIFLVIVMVRHLVRRAGCAAGNSATRAPRPSAPGACLKWGLFFGLTVLAVVNAGYLFERTFTPLKDYTFHSPLFRRTQQILQPVGSLPLPLPRAFVEGLDLVKYTDGHLRNNTYMLGEVGRDKKRFNGYFFFAILVKMPIATQVFILLALAVCMRRFAWRTFARDEIFLILPAAFFLIYFNFFFNTQIGIRFILVCFPLLFVLCGRLMPEDLGRGGKAAALTGCATVAISVLSYFPHYIPYFNEFVWDKTRAHRLLADSNLDWGQNDRLLRNYATRRPEVAMHPWPPAAGRNVYSVNYVTGILPPDRFGWLRESLTPCAHIGHSHLVYDLPPQAVHRLKARYPDLFQPQTPPQRRRHPYYLMNRWRADALMRIDQYDDAILYLERLIRFSPDDPLPYSKLASCRGALDRPLSSRPAGAPGAAPQWVETHYRLGLEAMRHERFALAAFHLDKVLDRVPDDEQARFFRGLVEQAMASRRRPAP